MRENYSSGNIFARVTVVCSINPHTPPAGLAELLQRAGQFGLSSLSQPTLNLERNAASA
jgi:hypothetical protein